MKKYIFKIVMLLLLMNISCSDDTEDIVELTPVVDQNPTSFNLLTVNNGATNVAVKPTLKWETAIDPEGGEVSYFLFMNDAPNPKTLVAGNLTSTEFQLKDRLSLEKQYYWQVVARDVNGNATKSDAVFSFTTRDLNFNNSPVTSNADFPVRNYHTTTVFDNKMWVIGGYDGDERGDVWHSTDGNIWTRATTNAAFSERRYHATAVFDNKMWVIGGHDGSHKNDVWYSTDGAAWFSTTTSASFSARQGHTASFFKNKLWVVGGDDNTLKNDVWNSVDGITWTEVSDATQIFL